MLEGAYLPVSRTCLALVEHCKADFDDDGEISANDYILFMNAYAIGQACP